MKKKSVLGILGILIIFGLAFLANQLLSHPGKQHFDNESFAGSLNSDSCASCHANGESLGDISNKKGYLIVGTQYDSVEAVIDDVMIPKYLEGKPIGKNSKQMKELVDYLKILTKGD